MVQNRDISAPAINISGHPTCTESISQVILAHRCINDEKIMEMKGVYNPKSTNIFSEK
jgi:hypothetical protein